MTCPRAHSDMTPCVLRDGQLALSDKLTCVGCGVHEKFISGEAPQVVNLNTPAPGERSFMACPCWPGGTGMFAVVAIHDAAGAFIAALVCSECGGEIPIVFGRPG